jgi:hypothetical protein
MSTTEATIIKQFGILLSFKDCAELLGRSSEGLRVTLSRDSELARKLKPAKIKIGRRVLFRASALAKLLDES